MGVQEPAQGRVRLLVNLDSHHRHLQGIHQRVLVHLAITFVLLTVRVWRALQVNTPRRLIQHRVRHVRAVVQVLRGCVASHRQAPRVHHRHRVLVLEV